MLLMIGVKNQIIFVRHLLPNGEVRGCVVVVRVWGSLLPGLWTQPEDADPSLFKAAALQKLDV